MIVRISINPMLDYLGLVKIIAKAIKFEFTFLDNVLNDVGLGQTSGSILNIEANNA
jgi:hypothetical protein